MVTSGKFFPLRASQGPCVEDTQETNEDEGEEESEETETEGDYQEGEETSSISSSNEDDDEAEGEDDIVEEGEESSSSIMETGNSPPKGDDFQHLPAYMKPSENTESSVAPMTQTLKFAGLNNETDQTTE